MIIGYEATVRISADVPGLTGDDGTFVSGPIQALADDNATPDEVAAAVLAALVAPPSAPMFVVGHLWVPLPNGEFAVVSSNAVTAFSVSYLAAEVPQ